MAIPNFTGPWNPQHVAQEVLIYMKANKRFLGLVNRGFERDRNSYEKGHKIVIKKLQTPTVRDDTDLSFDALTGAKTEMDLNYYKHASLDIHDTDLAGTTDQILESHGMPIADALIESISAHCLGIAYQSVGNHHIPGTIAIGDVTTPRRILQENRVPLDDRNLYYVASPTLDEGLLKLEGFTQHQGAGDVGVGDQQSGYLRRRFGFSFEPSQLVQTYTAPGSALSTTTLAVNGATAKDATVINLDAGSVTGVMNPGTVFTIAGDTTKYSVTNTVTASGNALAGVAISPPLRVAAADNAVVTVVAQSTFNNKPQSLAFHRQAFAFASAPLENSANFHGASARGGVATDPDSGLSFRLLTGYDLKTRKAMMVGDMLYGFKALIPEAAVRVMA